MMRSPVLWTFALWLSGSSAVLAADEPVAMQTVMVPMRDGVRLKTSVFHTGSLDQPRPVAMLRTPYNQTGFEAQARRVAAAGYVAVTQDCRGRFGSEGDFVFYWGEGPDGFDTVEWIRRQAWSNGRIGMWGPSYMGSVQWLTAAEGTPLTVLAPTASAPNFYYNLYLGGAYMLGHAKTGFCIDLFAKPTDLGSSPKWPEWYMHLPLTEWDQHIGRDVPWQMSMIRHYTPDGFWRRANVSTEFHRMNFPAQHIVGYYDFMCRESVRAFQAMSSQSDSEFSRSNQQLILGPWDHGTGNRKAGEIDFGPDAQLDVLAENIRWFDRFLRADVAKPAEFPTVRYFSMGENRWYEARIWPPENTVAKTWYLRSNGHANTRRGDGRLDFAAPGADEPADSFRSDPMNPVPCWPAKGTRYQEIYGPVDQALCQDRDDVLVYQTPALTEPLRFAGSPVVELWGAADAPDADWVVKLVDVHPSGYVQLLATGVRRGSARDSELHRSPLVSGKHYRIPIELGHAAAKVDAGHRLGIQIAGSNFPLFDRNTHTGAGPTAREARSAMVSVLHSQSEPTHLSLPVIAAER